MNPDREVAWLLPGPFSSLLLEQICILFLHNQRIRKGHILRILQLGVPLNHPVE